MPNHKPKFWYFPTPDPNVVIRCEYNASDDRYNMNCKTMKIPQLPNRIAIELKRFSNAINKYV